MPIIKGNRIGVTVYLTPETFRALEDMRKPSISSSAHYARILDAAVENRVE